jgi:7-cyano-7-deazaguanine synthase in queuosine biosynthesis
MKTMKAVILLSGGLDSSTVLHQAQADGCDCYAISFDYQQRHRRELESARLVAKKVGVIEHQIVNFDLRQWGGSALTDNKLDLPESRNLDQMAENIPITYVPARNTIFLSFALGYAEAIASERVYMVSMLWIIQDIPIAAPILSTRCRRFTVLVPNKDEKENQYQLLLHSSISIKQKLSN